MGYQVEIPRIQVDRSTSLGRKSRGNRNWIRMDYPGTDHPLELKSNFVVVDNWINFLSLLIYRRANKHPDFLWSTWQTYCTARTDFQSTPSGRSTQDCHCRSRTSRLSRTDLEHTGLCYLRCNQYADSLGIRASTCIVLDGSLGNNSHCHRNRSPDRDLYISGSDDRST